MRCILWMYFIKKRSNSKRNWNKNFNTDYILRELISGVSLIHISFICHTFKYKCVYLSGTFVLSVISKFMQTSSFMWMVYSCRLILYRNWKMTKFISFCFSLVCTCIGSHFIKINIWNREFIKDNIGTIR